METRRTFLQICTAALPLAGMSAPAFGGVPAPQAYRVVADTRTADGRAFAAEVRRLGGPVATPSEAVGALWADDLYYKWKVSKVPIAGLTDHATWFVLDLMASGEGLRTIYRAHHATSGTTVAHEVFGPHELLSHQTALENARHDWAVAAARAVASAPARASLARTRSTILDARDRMLGPGELVSWVIAAPVRA